MFYLKINRFPIPGINRKEVIQSDRNLLPLLPDSNTTKNGRSRMLILQAFAIQTASSCWLQLVSEFEKAPPMTENIIINSTEHFQQNDDW